MQTETKKVLQFLKRWLISTFAVLIAVLMIRPEGLFAGRTRGLA